MQRKIQYRCIRSAINNRNVAWLKKEQKDEPIFKAELTAVIATLTNKKEQFLYCFLGNGP